MLRVETKKSDGALICRLEGRFTGQGAEQVRTLVARCDRKLELVVDVTELMFIDAVGEDVLSLIAKLGGQFIAETAYSNDICERLQLPLFDGHTHASEFSADKNGNGHRTDSDCPSQ